MAMNTTSDALKVMRKQSRGEELTNTISHGLGIAASIAGTPYLILNSMEHGDTRDIVAASLFAASMIILYLASTLYHALPNGKLKEAFRVVEHSAIYILIAGTYTPFTLGILRGPMGWTLFGLIWVLALTGVILKVFAKLSPRVSICLYILMGWLILIAIGPLVERLPASGFFWLVGGGIAYTSGVIFFLNDDNLKFGHFIWHLFVITGTIFHYFAVLRYATG